MKKLFRPEFLNRIDEIIVFKSLTDEQIAQIVELMVADLRERMIAQNMSINLTPAATKLIAKEGTDTTFGARPLRRAIQRLLEDPLSEQILEGKWQSGSIVDVDVDESGENLEFKQGSGVRSRAAQARQHRARCRASAHELRLGPRWLAERGFGRRHGIGRRRRLAHESPKRAGRRMLRRERTVAELRAGGRRTLRRARQNLSGGYLSQVPAFFRSERLLSL